MKKFLMILLLAITCFAFYSDFCEGWNDGYIAGYCYQQGYYCVQPIVPICPIPRIGEDDYKSGYNRGFLAGLSTRR